MNRKAPEFSRVVNVTRIPPKGIEEQLEAKPDERAALAKRFDLVGLTALTAQLTLIPGEARTVHATGTLEADLVQSCVVTLEPIKSSLSLKIDVVFVPAETTEEDSFDDSSAELEDEIEPFTNGKIDLGELVAQQLGVNLDPYPRKPDAALTKTEFGAKSEPPRPFATLKSSVKSKKNKDKP